MNEQARQAKLQSLRQYPLLPMYYMLPQNVVKRINLSEFPRNPFEVINNPKWQGVYHSDYFLLALVDAWAWLMWQFMGIRGGMESYSGHDPFWIMAHNLTLWSTLLSEMGFNVDIYADLPVGDTLRYFAEFEVVHNCEALARRFWNHPKLKMQQVREIVDEYRSFEDYDARYSNIKIDFHRRYYHTRSKVKMLELDDEDRALVHEAKRHNPFREVEYRIWLEKFLTLLSENDAKIVKLLEMGYTQVEIAERLGYANHSGVSKRIKHIRTQMTKYRQEEFSY